MEALNSGTACDHPRASLSFPKTPKLFAMGTSNKDLDHRSGAATLRHDAHLTQTAPIMRTNFVHCLHQIYMYTIKFRYMYANTRKTFCCEFWVSCYFCVQQYIFVWFALELMTRLETCHAAPVVPALENRAQASHPTKPRRLQLFMSNAMCCKCRISFHNKAVLEGVPQQHSQLFISVMLVSWSFGASTSAAQRVCAMCRLVLQRLPLAKGSSKNAISFGMKIVTIESSRPPTRFKPVSFYVDCCGSWCTCQN